MTMSGTRRKPGQLGPYVDGYRCRLLELGYTPGTVRGQLKVLSQLGRWMASEGLAAEQLNTSPIEAFLAARRATGHLRVPTMRSFVSLVDYLRDEGVLGPEEPRPPLSPLDELIGQYKNWLIGSRALAPATVLRYESLARKFLKGRSSPADDLGLKNLAGADVVAFLRAECARISVGAAKGRVAELRSLLRFLYLHGLTALSLADAVPPVAGWRDTGLPVALAPPEVERLLASCDRSNLAGARDFAILVLLARLGFRSAEVARLELADLDWRAGEIVVRGKARRQDRLPLPCEVGEALVAYLSLADLGSGRCVFLTLRPPRRPIRADLVGDVVQRACKRAGLPHVGAHQLRHALATEMLRNGASLIDISQVLRHRDLATTAVYAKVDFARLRQVAQPWPGAGR
jgi:site-specific recombinase XerD